MIDWQQKTIVPEDGDESIIVDLLSIPDFYDLEIIHEDDGRYYVYAMPSCDGEIDIDNYGSLQEAKEAAVAWARDKATEILALVMMSVNLDGET